MGRGDASIPPLSPGPGGRGLISLREISWEMADLLYGGPRLNLLGLDILWFDAVWFDIVGFDVGRQ